MFKWYIEKCFQVELRIKIFITIIIADCKSQKSWFSGKICTQYSCEPSYLGSKNLLTDDIFTVVSNARDKK